MFADSVEFDEQALSGEESLLAKAWKRLRTLFTPQEKQVSKQSQQEKQEKTKSRRPATYRRTFIHGRFPVRVMATKSIKH